MNFPTNPNHGHPVNPRNQGGFTIAELLIASVILAFLLTTAAILVSNFFNSLRNIQAANTVYDEANFTMDRIIREIRNGTVDYEEYYNQKANFFGTETNETYGQNYCQYSRQFYAPGLDGQFGTFDDESTGIRRDTEAKPIESPLQKKLYLISSDGLRRTYVQHVLVEKKDATGKLITIGKVAMLKLIGKDYGINHLAWSGNPPQCRDSGEEDGLIDTWVCDSGYKCAKEPVTYTINNGAITCNGTLETPLDTPGHLNDADTVADGSSFIDITPETIDVVSLEFIITPQDDPRKAYNDAEVQVQPNVTVKMVTRAAPQLARTFTGQTPGIVLESTISTRATKEIITECNLQECIDGDPKPCPKHTGILEGATQTCSQGVWPGCVEKCDPPAIPGLNCYEEVSKQFFNFTDPTNPLFSGIRGSASDGSLTSDELTAIQSDGKDHVGPFRNNPRIFYEPTGGEMGSCESDVSCKNRRCNDGVDNDVNDKTDSADPACLNYVCNNGYLDPGERCIDVGDICAFVHPLVGQENVDLNTCTDGYDNDCSYNFELKWNDLDAAEQAKAQSMGLNSNATVAQLNIVLGLGADEYDQNCIDKIFCDNGIKDPQLKPFGPKLYETPNYTFNKPASNDLNETCVDIGGLCDRATDVKHKKGVKETGSEMCKDGLDNDCDYTPAQEGTGADEFDADCKAAYCQNGFLDSDLAGPEVIASNPAEYAFDYLVNYTDTLGQNTTLDEVCTDVGGLCGNSGQAGGIQAENSNFDTCTLVCPPASSLCVPDCMCFDGINNDCTNGTDGIINASIPIYSDTRAPSETQADPNCCPDGDGDAFAPYIANTCHPATAIGSAPPGLIDCDDNASDIKPGATEICDDAKDSSNNPIDNNCSASNKLYGDNFGDSGWDHNDPTCCVDTDGDGFGVKDALLYVDASSVDNPKPCSLGNSAMLDFTEKPTILYGSKRYAYDCDDINKDINPSIIENTVALCSDGLNNSCRFVNSDTAQPRKDHIDMYATTPGLLTAFANKLFNPDCCQLTQDPKFQGMEICDDGKSLLTAGANSDENCNGKEGYDDVYCLGADYLKFHDNLTSNTYLLSSSAEFTASHNQTNGVITVSPIDEPLPQVALSNTLPVDTSTCATINEVILNHDADLPTLGTTISYELSNDGGTTWKAALAGEATPMDTTGVNLNRLRWKATLQGDGVDKVPTLNKITLTWTCN